jgi:AraC-like DNA-binding protein
MTSLPIPFVVAILLLVLTISNHEQLKETATGRVFALLLYLHTVSMLLIGLRWSRDWGAVLPVVATLAVITAALLYLAFRSLGRAGPVISLSRDWMHLIPTIIVAISALFFFRWVDFFLLAAKCLYSALLIKLARKMPDSLQLVRLSWLKNTQKSLWGAAILLIVSIILDVMIAIDFALYQGKHAANLVGLASMGLLLLLAWASVSAGRAKAQHSTDESIVEQISEDASVNDEQTDADSLALMQELNRLLIAERLYADTELNLQRLARKAGVPARSVSRTINAHTGQNISQWVNTARIDAACELLRNSEVTVTQAMLDAGFLTKSNFHREFKRIKGCSPSQWREEG